jgi:hypothetical protein
LLILEQAKKSESKEEAALIKVQAKEFKHRAQESSVAVNNMASEVATQLINKAEETAIEIKKQFFDQQASEKV